MLRPFMRLPLGIPKPFGSSCALQQEFLHTIRVAARFFETLPLDPCRSFQKYFGDFAARFGIRDMYSGGFYPFPDEEIRWAWWARHIYYNRYVPAPKPVYDDLQKLVQD